MLPKTHFFVGLVFVIVLFILKLVTPFQALIILSAAFFIDVDHWLNYVWNKKDLSLKRAYAANYKVYLNKKSKAYFHIFHTIESYLLIGVLAVYFSFFYYVFIGMLFHIAFDFFHDACYKGFYGRRVSLIYSLISK